MTPSAVLAGIPTDLLRRHPDPTKQLANVRSLAAWLDARGIRPSLAEIEAERARRAPTRRRSKATNRPGPSNTEETQR